MLSTREKVFVTLGLFLALLVAFPIGDDFGASTDEVPNVQYGEATLAAYLQPGAVDASQIRKRTGSFYLMIWAVGSKKMASVVGWSPVDLGHFFNYVTFLAAAGSLYMLARRALPVLPAIAATLLFFTQPLLFGHAFINQKDTPFMAFYTLAVTSGVYMVDQLRSLDGKGQVSQLTELASVRAFRARWREPAFHRRRWLLLIWTGVGSVLFLDLFVFHAALLPLLQRSVDSLYHGRFPMAAANQWFARAAENSASLPVEAYLHKVTQLYSRARWLVAMGILMGVAVLAFPLMADVARSIRGREALSEGLRLARPNRCLLVAGLLLGLGVATRPPGIFAGALVLFYAFWCLGLRSVFVAGMYLALGAVTTYALWPALWGAPLDWYVDSLQGNLNFPGGHEVLFRGITYHSNDLPWDYLPWLLVVQLTPPLSFLASAGLVVAVRRLRGCKADLGLLLLLLIWFLAPLFAVVVLRTPIYSNFRQLLFTLSPIFVLAGFSFLWLVEKRKKGLYVVCLALALMPGLVAIVRLHPYQYVYYNFLVGGLRGAEKNYLLDYWCTSYRELTERLNEVAPPGARYTGWGPVRLTTYFARRDLVLADTPEEDVDYAVACSWGVFDQRFYPEGTVVWEVKRDGATLGIIKELP